MVLGLGALAQAQPPTVTLNLTGVSGGVLGGVYTSPYEGNINGGATIPIICDDFADESYLPETWTAYDTNLSSLSPSTTDSYLKWGADVNTSLNLGQAQEYAVAAYLITELLTPNTGLNNNDLSFAIWGLFDQQAFSSIGGSDLTNAQSYLAQAISANPSASSYTNVNIYSYVPGSGVTNCGGCNPPPQEFITVAMPEASSLTLSCTYLLGAMIIGLFFYRRQRLQR